MIVLACEEIKRDVESLTDFELQRFCTNHAANTVVKRTLSAAAFEYVLSSDAVPSESDLTELLNITDTLFSDMFAAFFKSRPEAGYRGVEISALIAHRRNFIEYIVDMFFEDLGAVPDLAQVEEVARQQLGSGAEYRDLYLQLLKASPIYGTTTLLLYVSDRAELNALIALSEPEPELATNQTIVTAQPNSVRDGGSSGSSSEVTRIVTPLAAFAGVLLLLGALVHVQRNRNSGSLDKHENLMKHTRDEGYYAETGTVSGNTYRTGAFSDDGTENSPNPYDEYSKYKRGQKMKPETEKGADLEEVSLGDDARSTRSVNSATHSRTNSNDSETSAETMIKVARESMTADVFKPKRSALYDERMKPTWASRGNYAAVSMSKNTNMIVATPQVEESVTSVASADISSPDIGTPEMYFAKPPMVRDATVKMATVSESVKNELSIPELLDTNNRSTAATLVSKPVMAVTNAPEFSSDISEHTSLPVDSEPKPELDAAQEMPIVHVARSQSTATGSIELSKVDDSRPAWMKAQLKSVASNPSSPSRKWVPPPAPTSAEPEWMQKFKQMGLDKNA
jgi:hypothetical protein